MTARITLESPRGNIDLDGIARTGFGWQVQAGVTGLGLPGLDAQFFEGAGDGAVFRSARTLVRDIDLPLVVLTRTPNELRAEMSALARVLMGSCVMRWDDDTEVGSWTLQVVRVGGGDYAYGEDTIGEFDASTTITVRAGDPYWERSYEDVASVKNSYERRGLLDGALTSLRMTSTKTLGTVVLDNVGDAPAFPKWTIKGPGTSLTLRNDETGEVILWRGSLGEGERLYIDTRTAAVIDGQGINRYADLDAAPRFWRLQPGITHATASMDGATPESTIECLWRPRKWLVI